MDKLSRLERFLLGRSFTIGMNLVALGLLLLIAANEIQGWLMLVRSGEGAGAAAHSKSGAAGVILVALGVILEGRHTFVNRVMKVHNLDAIPGQEEFSDICHVYGFYLLITGLFIECLGELVKFIDPHLSILHGALQALTTGLNLLAIAFLCILIVKVARMDLTAK